MGWTCYQLRRDEAVNRELRDHGTLRRGFRVVKRKWEGWGKLWVLCEMWRPGDDFDEALVVRRYIGVLLCESHPSRGEWCMKFVDDDQGPVETSAPLSWLNEVTLDDREGTAYAWYERVRAYHRRRGTGRVLKVNDLVLLKAGGSAQVISVSPLRVMHAGHSGLIDRKSIDWESMATE